jgi:hypothetical protein
MIIEPRVQCSASVERQSKRWRKRKNVGASTLTEHDLAVNIASNPNQNARAVMARSRILVNFNVHISLLRSDC